MRIADLKSQIDKGGLHEALIRSLLYIGIARGYVDERGFEMIRRIRQAHAEKALSLAEFKKTVREQFFMLLIDEDAAVAAIPALLPVDAAARASALDILKQVLRSSGEIKDEIEVRLQEITRLFALSDQKRPFPGPSPITVSAIAS
jgi:hypothetical protein